MHPMRRAPVILLILPILALVLAACAPAGTGGGNESNDATTAPMSSEPMSSEPMTPGASGSLDLASDDPSDEIGEPTGRVDIDDVLTDPASFAGGDEVTIAENVEEVLVEETAFVISGTMVEGNLLVVLTPDAEIEKEIQVDRVVDITGTIVAIDELESTDAAVSTDDPEVSGFDGEYAIVATVIGDPLAD